MISTPRPLNPSDNASGEFESGAQTPICCRSIRKSFGNHDVLQGVDLEIPSGAIVGLLGGNGCGKSTLIQCLVGLLRVGDGTARVLGEDPWDLSPAAKSRLGYVPQQITLYPWMTVRLMIEYFAAFYEAWDHEYVSGLSERFELDRNKMVRTLSVGQKQRLAIVLALGHRPDVMILDEPASSLDSSARRALIRELLESARSRGQTTLFSTHITSDLDRVASHVAMMRHGRIVQFGELDQWKERVKRLHLTGVSSEWHPSGWDILGEVRRDGQDAVVTVSDFDEVRMNEWASEQQVHVKVEDLNLEDILLEMQHD